MVAESRRVVVHSVFDLLAWLAAALIAWWIRRTGWLVQSMQPTLTGNPGYFIALSLGGLGGALAFGSLNLDLAGLSFIGHSRSSSFPPGQSSAFCWA
jgi:hypothetical protein